MCDHNDYYSINVCATLIHLKENLESNGKNVSKDIGRIGYTRYTFSNLKCVACSNPIPLFILKKDNGIFYVRSINMNNSKHRKKIGVITKVNKAPLINIDLSKYRELSTSKLIEMKVALAIRKSIRPVKCSCATVYGNLISSIAVTLTYLVSNQFNLYEYIGNNIITNTPCIRCGSLNNFYLTVKMKKLFVYQLQIERVPISRS
jgi:hypothetical protein